MKALVYTGPKTLVFRDEPDPQANEDVVVKVDVCGICGSDMHVYLGHNPAQPPPEILGHEAAGVVVSGKLQGQRVAVNPIVSCSDCDVCRSGRQHLCRERQVISRTPRPGAFAEYVRAPERNLFVVPDSLSTEMAALAEPFAVGYHAVNLGERAVHVPLAGANVAVIGGGPIGLVTAQILQSRGARNILIAETSEGRRTSINVAGRFGTYDPVSGSKPAAASLDLIIDAYGGKSSREEAVRLVKYGGTIVHVGLASAEGGVEYLHLTRGEISLIGSFAYTPVEFRETLAGLAAGIFGPIDWTEQRPLSEGVAAFAELAAGKVASAKILLKM
jgi:2-desacetyl-2-hydroxyethyl bacteriochlorophyllide A dehydrogenase